MHCEPRERPGILLGVVFSLVLLLTGCETSRLPDAPRIDEGIKTGPPPVSLMMRINRSIPIAIGGTDELNGGDDDELEREDDSDVRLWDAALISVEEGGEVEIGENHIDIPPFAVDQDTWVVLYIPESSIVEYWVYPPDLSFNIPVEVRLSYDSASLYLVNEENVSIDQWLPDIQNWDIVGGLVDTVGNCVTVDVTSFPPPEQNSGRYALADHN